MISTEFHRVRCKQSLTDTLNSPVFEIFSDRIEMTSIGGMSAIKNTDDFFLEYSKPTSRELMRIYKDLGLVEYPGSEPNRMLEVYDKDSFIIKQNYMKNIERWLKQLRDEEKVEFQDNSKTGGYVVK
jgi:ATP-dependent DNA helicase RecG